MALEAHYFPLTNALDIQPGDRIRYTTKSGDTGVATIALIWLGIEECVNVERDDGRRLTLVPALGDLIESPHEPPLSGSPEGGAT